MLDGTVWDFTNTKRVSRGALDLLVIDEAGRFPLAQTLAASVSAQRQLLLGDPNSFPKSAKVPTPNRLTPQPSAGCPRVTPRPPYGYFLDQPWRMHPDLTARVSDQAYDARLTAKVAHQQPKPSGRSRQSRHPGTL